MTLKGLPKAHQLNVAHSIRPSLDDLFWLITEATVDAEARAVAMRRWEARVAEVFTEEGLSEPRRGMPYEWLLEMLGAKRHPQVGRESATDGAQVNL